jgi:hypothetical protein
MAAPGKIVTFDNDPLGKAPPGWSVVAVNGVAAPQWEVRRDQTGPTQSRVLALAPPAADASRSALTLLNSVSLRDGDVSVRVKSVGGSHVQAGGVVFRYRDANNYYLARADALQQNVALFKVENGRSIPVGQAVRHDLPANAWRILKVSARGSDIQIYLDHRRILQAKDGAFTGSGKVGLWAAGDSVTYFDDFRVDPK